MGGASGKSSVSGRTSTHDVEAIVVGPTPQPLGTASGKHEVTEIRSIDTMELCNVNLHIFTAPKPKA